MLVVLSKLNRVLSNSGRPSGHTVYGDLSCFVNTDSVEIESSKGDTREFDEPLHDTWFPSLQEILHGGELTELTIGVDAEDPKISVLTKIRSLTSI